MQAAVEMAKRSLAGGLRADWNERGCIDRVRA